MSSPHSRKASNNPPRSIRTGSGTAGSINSDAILTRGGSYAPTPTKRNPASSPRKTTLASSPILRKRLPSPTQPRLTSASPAAGNTDRPARRMYDDFDDRNAGNNGPDMGPFYDDGSSYPQNNRQPDGYGDYPPPSPITTPSSNRPLGAIQGIQSSYNQAPIQNQQLDLRDQTLYLLETESNRNQQSDNYRPSLPQQSPNQPYSRDSEKQDEIVTNDESQKIGFRPVSSMQRQGSDASLLSDSSTDRPSGSDSIRVVCRFRPSSEREMREGGREIVEFDDAMTLVQVNSKDYPTQYSFDRIFDLRFSQADIFDYTAKSIIADVFKGYNGTLFCYGQTGSGKTHTMMGDIDNGELRGIIPRAVDTIFGNIFSAPSHIEFAVRVSFMEIYMERIRDLLNPANDNLPVHEERGRGVFVKGLLEVFVGSMDEVYSAMRQGQRARMTSMTSMNVESSRSHSIFIIQISQKNTEDGTIKNGKLFLVDLAGSEKVAKTGATGVTLDEAKNINLSLSCLGNVIYSLTDDKRTHVPYRDSKLTRILQESLGGNSKTTLIINCSPNAWNELETLSTLRFGVRAKRVKNNAKVNSEMSPIEMKKQAKRLKQEIRQLQTYVDSLQGELTIWRSGSTVDQSNWAVLPDLSITAAIDQQKVPAPILTPGSPSARHITDTEKENFLKREAELLNSIASKEAELESKTSDFKALEVELAFYRESDSLGSRENKNNTETIKELQSQIELLTSENQENTIGMDNLIEANLDMSSQMLQLKKENQRLKMREMEQDTITEELTTAHDLLTKQEAIIQEMSTKWIEAQLELKTMRKKPQTLDVNTSTGDIEVSAASAFKYNTDSNEEITEPSPGEEDGETSRLKTQVKQIQKQLDQARLLLSIRNSKPRSLDETTSTTELNAFESRVDLIQSKEDMITYSLSMSTSHLALDQADSSVKSSHKPLNSEIVFLQEELQNATTDLARQKAAYKALEKELKGIKNHYSTLQQRLDKSGTIDNAAYLSPSLSMDNKLDEEKISTMQFQEKENLNELKRKLEEKETLMRDLEIKSELQALNSGEALESVQDSMYSVNSELNRTIEEVKDLRAHVEEKELTLSYLDVVRSSNQLSPSKISPTQYHYSPTMSAAAALPGPMLRELQEAWVQLEVQTEQIGMQKIEIETLKAQVNTALQSTSPTQANRSLVEMNGRVKEQEMKLAKLQNDLEREKTARSELDSRYKQNMEAAKQKAMNDTTLIELEMARKELAEGWRIVELGTNILQIDGDSLGTALQVFLEEAQSELLTAQNQVDEQQKIIESLQEANELSRNQNLGTDNVNASMFGSQLVAQYNREEESESEAVSVGSLKARLQDALDRISELSSQLRSRVEETDSLRLQLQSTREELDGFKIISADVQAKARVEAFQDELAERRSEIEFLRLQLENVESPLKKNLQEAQERILELSHDVENLQEEAEDRRNTFRRNLDDLEAKLMLEKSTCQSLQLSLSFKQEELAEAHQRLMQANQAKNEISQQLDETSSKLEARAQEIAQIQSMMEESEAQIVRLKESLSQNTEQNRMELLASQDRCAVSAEENERLKDEVTAMTTKVYKQSEDIERLQASLDVSSERIELLSDKAATLSQSLDDRTSDLQISQAQCQALKDDITLLQSDDSQLSELKEALLHQLNQKQLELVDSQDQYATSLKDNERLKDELTTMASKFQTLTEEKAILQASVYTTSAQIEILNDNATNLARLLEDRFSELQVSQAQCAALKDDILQLQGSGAQQSELKESLNQQLEQKHQELLASRERYTASLEENGCLKDEMATLTAKVYNQSDEIGRLQSSLDTASEQIDSLHENVAALNRSLDDRASEIQVSQAQCAALKDDILQLQGSGAQQSELKESLYQQLAQKEQELLASQDRYTASFEENARLNDEIAALTAKIYNQSEEVEKLQASLDASSERIEALSKKTAALDHSLEERASELQDSHAQCTALYTDVRRLTDETESLTEALSQQLLELEHSRSELSSCQIRIESMNSEVVVIQESLQTQNTKFTSEISKAEGEISKFKNHVNDLRLQLDSTIRELSETQTKYTISLAENERLSRDVASMSLVLSDKSSDEQTLFSELCDANERKVALAAENAKLNGIIEEKNAQSAALKSKLDTKATEIAELIEEVVRLSNDIDASKLYIEQLESSKEEQKEEIQTALASLTDRNRQIDALKDETVDYKTQYHGLVVEADGLRKTIQQFRDRSDILTDEIARLSTEVRRGKDEFALANDREKTTQTLYETMVLTNQSLSTNLAEKTSLLENLQTEADRMSHNLGNVSMEAEALRLENENQKADILATRTRAQQLSMTVDEQQSVISDWMRKFNQQSTILNSAEIEIQSLKLNLSEKVGEANNTGKEAQNFKQECDELKKKLSDSLEQAQQLREESYQRQLEIANLKQQSNKYAEEQHVLEERNRGLQSNLTEVQARLTHATDTVNRLEANVIRLGELLSDSADKAERKTSQIDELKETIEKHVSTINDINGKLEEEHQVSTNLRDNIIKLQEQYQHAEAAIHERESQISELNAKIIAAGEELNATRDRLSDEHKQIEGISHQAADANDRILDLTRQLETYEMSLKRRDSEVEEKISIIQDLQRQFISAAAKAEEDLDALKAAISEKDSNIAAVEQFFGNSQQELEELKAHFEREIAVYQTQMEGLNRTLEEKTAHVASAEVSCSLLKESLAEASNRTASLEEKNEELHKEIRTHVTHIAQLSARKEEESEKLVEQTEKYFQIVLDLNSLKSKFEAEQSTFQDTNAKLADAQEVIHQKEEEIIKLRSSMSESQSASIHLSELKQQELDALKSAQLVLFEEKDRLAFALEVQTKTVFSLEEGLASRDAAIAEDKQKLEQVQNEIQKTLSELSIAQLEKEQVKDELEASQSQANGLQERCSSLDAQVKAMEKRLTETISQISKVEASSLTQLTEAKNSILALEFRLSEENQRFSDLTENYRTALLDLSEVQGVLDAQRAAFAELNDKTTAASAATQVREQDQALTIATLRDNAVLKDALLIEEKERVSAVLKELEEAKAELEATRRDKANLSIEQASKQLELFSLRNKCESLNSKIQELESSLENAVTAAKETEEQGMSTMMDTMESIQQLQSRLQEAENRLKKASMSRENLANQMENQIQAHGHVAAAADEFLAQISEQTDIIESMKAEIDKLTIDLDVEKMRAVEAAKRPEAVPFSTSTSDLSPLVDIGTQAINLGNDAITSTSELNEAVKEKRALEMQEKLDEISALQAELEVAKKDLKETQSSLTEILSSTSNMDQKLREILSLEAVRAKEVDRLKSALGAVNENAEAEKKKSATLTSMLQDSFSQDNLDLSLDEIPAKANPERELLARKPAALTENAARYDQLHRGESSNIVSTADLRDYLSRQVSVADFSGSAEPFATESYRHESVNTSNESLHIAGPYSRAQPQSHTTIQELLTQQLHEFKFVKQKLMTEVQLKSERIADLESSLEDVKKQYDSVLKTFQSKSQMQKMQFLEKNLAQLTVVQKRLVEQNTELKMNIQTTEEAIAVRDDRIQALEKQIAGVERMYELQKQRFETKLSVINQRRTSNISPTGDAVSKVMKDAKGGPSSDTSQGSAINPTDNNAKKKGSSWILSMMSSI